MPDEETYSLNHASPDMIADLLNLDYPQRELFRLIHRRAVLQAELKDVEKGIQHLTQELIDDPA